MKRLTIEILALFILFGCVRADIDEPTPEKRIAQLERQIDPKTKP